MSKFREKFQEVLAAVVPVCAYVFVVQLLFRPLLPVEFGRFLFGAFFIIVGMTLFLIGIDLSIRSMGAAISKALVRSGRFKLILLAAFALGFIINVAEPDLWILARNVEAVSAGHLPSLRLIFMVSAGVGAMVLVAFLRMMRHFSLRRINLIVYGMIFLLALFCPPQYFAVAFDASGATTGAITTPFLLALAGGLSLLSHHEEAETFGMVGFASAGAILAVLCAGILSGHSALKGGSAAFSRGDFSFLSPFLQAAPGILRESLLALLPLALIFFFINHFGREIRPSHYPRLLIGLTYCALGLILLSLGVAGGFMAAGQHIGAHLAAQTSPFLLLCLAFFLGLTVVLAEPAVHVLTEEIETQSGGAISKKLVLLFMSAGVAIAVSLAMLRILIPSLQLWHLLLPAYALALICSVYSGELFSGIAFDSGGVVSGPMTATFVLAFAQGAASAIPGADVVLDGFGIIALVAVSPLISLQILGLLYRRRNVAQSIPESEV